MKPEELTIALIAEELPDGTSTRVLCEFCHSSSPTMSITKHPGKIVYHCFRASCGESGSIGAAPRSSVAKEKPAPRLFEWPTHELSAEDERFFSERFEITNIAALRRWVKVTDGGFAFPILNPYGGIRGWTHRRGHFSGDLQSTRLSNVLPKTRTFKHEDGPLLAWYFPTGAPCRMETVLVEDQVSAIKVALNANCVAVALIGTEINHAKAAEIQKYASRWVNGSRMGNQIIIALDPDATEKAIKHAQTWGLGFDSCRVHFSAADPKDLPLDEFWRW